MGGKKGTDRRKRGGRRKGGRGSATSTFLSEVSQICGASVAGLTRIKARFLNWYIVEEFNLSNCTGVRWRKGLICQIEY